MVELLTLTESDLRELGVGGEDTGRVLSLIHKIKHMSSPHTPQSEPSYTHLMQNLFFTTHKHTQALLCSHSCLDQGQSINHYFE